MKLLTPIVFALFLGAASATAADLYVDAIHGDDIFGLGTATAPWKSITVGVGNAYANDVVHAAPGIYDVANGESFPIAISYGVSLVGAGSHMSIIDGTGVSWSSQTAMLALNGGPVEIAGFLFRNGPTANWWDSTISCWMDCNAIIRDNVFAGPALNRAFVFFDWGASPTSTSSVIAYNNITFDTVADAYLVHDYANITIFNNTAIATGRAGFSFDQNNTVTYGSIFNNIACYNLWAGIECGPTPQVPLINNCLYQNVVSTTGTFLSETGTLLVDPQFVSHIDKDYHLTPTSPCVDAGIASGVPMDIDGETRLNGGLDDLGADEMHSPSTYIRKPIEQGQISAIVTVGKPNETYFQVISAVPATVPTGYGMLMMDPKYMIILVVGKVPANGAAGTLIGVPAAPAFVGIPVIAQSLVKYTLSGAVTFTLL